MSDHYAASADIRMHRIRTETDEYRWGSEMTEQSPDPSVESILLSLEGKGPAAAPVLEATALATSRPEAVCELAVAVMRRFPKGGTFLDAALSFLPEEMWPELVRLALNQLDLSGGKNAAAESVVSYASFQSPSALHPHLDRIFEIRPNAGTYYECYPWRESGDQQFDFLRTILNSLASTHETRRRAWTAMLETRHARVLDYAITHADLADFSPAERSGQGLVQAHLHLVGFQQADQSLRRICPDSLYHFQFPEEFFSRPRPPWLARVHPTWKLPASNQSVSFGGFGHSRCSVCGEKLHRLVVLDPLPDGLEITGLTRLEFATCLSCLGWEQRRLFYRHDEHGVPSHAFYDGPVLTPKFPVGPLKESKIGLAKTPHRWFWQDWACSNGRENLDRLGGEPCWIQSAEYPDCPSCKRLMPYVFQLDSDLPTEEGGEWLWGSGGIIYAFWCDDCKISGLIWQCT